MASTAKPARKKFRVAVSGATVDGREISGEHLKAAAESYDPSVYAARVNVEHYLSMLPNSDFSAMGDVTGLSAEDITDGPLKGRTALYAEIEPSARMKQLTDEGKKVYSSIELHPQFALNGNAYVVGLAMTDTPATTEAVAHVTDELQEWQQQQQAEGYSTLADAPTIKPNGEPEIPPRKINGESINIHRYRRAVYAATRALILESARDVDTTNKSDRKADALDTQAEDLWRDVRWAIADIRGAQRIWAELC
ncbi:GPO family capsid scaffolding protein [Escherichia coli]